MKGISFNSDGFQIKENIDLYHDRVERLVYMSGVLGRPDWQSPINDIFFRNTDIDDLDDLINSIILLLNDEPDIDIKAISAEVVSLDDDKSGLKLKFEFEEDKNTVIDNKNSEGFTFFSIYEA
jgi:hypothetical protein